MCFGTGSLSEGNHASETCCRIVYLDWQAKHGKTEFYRDLLRHMATSREVFEIAPGARGMVMIVFTLPSYEVVFKIIKDRFDHPKKTTRAEVMQKYRLVFAHDRAGRLVDAQEFEHLRFERELFSRTCSANFSPSREKR